MFDNDPFEDIVKQFFGNSATVRRRRSVDRIRDEEEQNTQFIEDEEYIYFIMDLPGYAEKDIRISVKENILLVSAKASQKPETQDYLAQKHREGITTQQQIPYNIKNKNFSKTFRNGVLEITFIKK